MPRVVLRDSAQDSLSAPEVISRRASCELYWSVKVMVVACDKLPEVAVTVIV
jgi:hypothetical protein